MTNKNLKTIYIILPLIALVLISVTSMLKNSKNPNIASPISVKDNTPIFNGHDWKEVNDINMTAYETVNIKASILRATLETGIINNNPLITPTEPLASYLDFIDKFYSDDTNLQIPIAFALKIADMSKKGVSEVALERYKMAFLRKLKQARLVEQ